MWIWIISLTLVLTNLASCTFTENEFEEEPLEDVIFFVNEKPLKELKPSDEGTAIHRPNFLRFGVNDFYSPQRNAYDASDETEDLMAPNTYKRNNFMRFGRSNDDRLIDIIFDRDIRSSDGKEEEKFMNIERNAPHIRAGRSRNTHLRIGRSYNPYMRVGKSYNPAIRLGRSIRNNTERKEQEGNLRKKRDANEETASQQEKHQLVNGMRMGRSNNFMRFGRNLYREDEPPAKHVRTLPPAIMHLFKELVTRLISEEKCTGYSRAG